MLHIIRRDLCTQSKTGNDGTGRQFLNKMLIFLRILRLSDRAYFTIQAFLTACRGNQSNGHVMGIVRIAVITFQR